jgi:PAS domain S-box-containing protein
VSDDRAARGVQSPEELGIGHLFWLTSDAIVAADLETQRIVLWNPSAAALFGYRAEDALGMPLERLVPDELREAHLAGIARYATTGEGRLVGAPAVEVAAMTSTGERRDVSLSITDLTVETGRRVALAVIRDVTTEREAEREIRRMNATMRDFIATAAHDLRSPLAAIRGFVAVLGMPNVPDERRDEIVAAIQRNSDAASRLVDDLLMLSKLESDALATRPVAVRIVEVVHEVIGSTDHHAEVSAPADLHVHADPDHLRRIVVNYLANAHRYGGPPFAVEARRHDDVVHLEVRDGGAGVPDELDERLFTPFATTSAAPSGNGLGLSIVRGLAHANGGDAYYERRDGQTVFGVTLPFTAA